MRDKPLVLLVEDTLSLAAIYREYLKEEPVDVRALATSAIPGRDFVARQQGRLLAGVHHPPEE